jgi:hypothetical protein
MGCGASKAPEPTPPPAANRGRRYSTKSGAELVNHGNDLKVKTKKDAEEKKKLLEKELAEVDEVMAETMKSLVAQGADGHDDDDDEHEEDEDPTAVPTSKLEAWEQRKKKYRGYADKGKVEKLEKARDKQKAKASKAEETKKDKPYYEAYVKYKCASRRRTPPWIGCATPPAASRPARPARPLPSTGTRRSTSRTR